MHIADPEERYWLMKEFEQLAVTPPSQDDKLKLLDELTKTETFNKIQTEKYASTKRFGVEGLDMIVPGMSTPSPI